MNAIPEPDWRLLSKLTSIALDRLCERILNDLKQIASDTRENHHQRYGRVFGLIEEQDKKVAYIFDGLSRSNALTRLAYMRGEQLITGEEMAMFSSATQSSIAERTV